MKKILIGLCSLVAGFCLHGAVWRLRIQVMRYNGYSDYPATYVRAGSRARFRSKVIGIWMAAIGVSIREVGNIRLITELVITRVTGMTTMTNGIMVNGAN